MTGFTQVQAAKTLLLKEEIAQLRRQGHSTAALIEQLQKRLRFTTQPSSRSESDENSTAPRAQREAGLGHNPPHNAPHNPPHSQHKCSPTMDVVKTFTCTGVDQVYTVPPTAVKLTVTLAGAAGGGSNSGGHKSAGGNGGQATAEIPVTPAVVLVAKLAREGISALGGAGARPCVSLLTVDEAKASMEGMRVWTEVHDDGVRRRA